MEDLISQAKGAEKHMGPTQSPSPMGPGSGAYPPVTPPGPGSGGFPPPAPQVAYVVKPRPKWYALRTIAGILKFFAWITAGFGAIAVIFALVFGSQFGSFGILGALLFGVATAIGAGAAFLGMYGYAELILVLVSIEENTRKL
jgi:hypothetical protein